MPKAVTDLQPHQQRVVIERHELGDRLSKLSQFLIGETARTIPPEEHALLSLQHDIMMAYQQVLDIRIGGFK